MLGGCVRRRCAARAAAWRTARSCVAPVVMPAKGNAVSCHLPRSVCGVVGGVVGVPLGGNQCVATATMEGPWS